MDGVSRTSMVSLGLDPYFLNKATSRLEIVLVMRQLRNHGVHDTTYSNAWSSSCAQTSMKYTLALRCFTHCFQR